MVDTVQPETPITTLAQREAEAARIRANAARIGENLVTTIVTSAGSTVVTPRTPDSILLRRREMARARRERLTAVRESAEMVARATLAEQGKELPIDTETLVAPKRRRKKAIEATVAAEADAAADIAVVPESKSRVLTFDPFTIAGTAESPVFIVTRHNIMNILSQRETDHGLTDRLQICRGYLSDGTEIYSFTEAKLRQLVKSLRRIVTSRCGTDMRYVERVVIGSRSRLPAELAEHFSIDEFPEFQIEDAVGLPAAITTIAATLLGPLLKRKIIFTRNGEFSERGGFQIHIASSSEIRTRRYEHVSQIFGIADNNSYSTSIRVYHSEIRDAGNASNAIMINDDSYNIAELYSNGLLILAELSDTFQSIRIFHHILMEVAKYITDPEEYQRIIAEREKKLRESQRKHIIDCATAALQYGRDVRSQTSRASLKKQIEEAQQNLFLFHQRLFAIENTNTVAATDRIAREFDRLSDGKINLVKKVYFASNGEFHVITDPIIAYDRDTRHHHMLGECEIIVAFPGRDRRYGSVRIYQTAAAGRSRRDLPHCRDGTVCFGNIQDAITALVAGFEIEALVSLVITFLLRPNPFDRDGQRVRGFPVVPAPVKGKKVPIDHEGYPIAAVAD